MAAVGAGIFAAQMVNFPVSSDTSGHLIGGALAAMVLGPWAAMLVMATVLIVQALVFADGGIAALGANILNMGVIAPLTGFGMYRLSIGSRARTNWRLVAAGAGGAVSVWAAAAACSIEMAAAGTHALKPTLAAMMAAHLPIGLSEGLITAAVMAALAAGSCVLQTGGNSTRYAAIALAVLIVVSLAPLASQSPDGLEAVAHRLGFVDLPASPPVTAVAADYAMPGVSHAALSTIAAGIAGLALCALALWSIGHLARGNRMHHADWRK